MASFREEREPIVAIVEGDAPEFCSGVARVVEISGLYYFYRYVLRPSLDGDGGMEHVALPTVVMPHDGVVRAVSLTIAALKEHIGDGHTLPLMEWHI